MKRAQSVSIFIIIGILLLLVFALWQGMSTKEARRSFEREAAPSIEQVPTEARPVFEFITDCISTVAKDGFVKLGDQGGYLDTTHLAVNHLAPTESEGVKYHFASEITIPYWWHMENPNNCEKTAGCVFTSERPGLHEGSAIITIEEQVQDYIEENLPICLRSFEPFKTRGLSIDVKKDPQADVIVAKNGVTAIVNMPIRIKSPTATHNYELFVTEFKDFNFLDIYTLATSIAELQANYSFLEKQAMNLISLYSGIDAELPPIGATEFTMGQGKFWIKKTVMRNIKNNILAPYVPMLQVFGTANFRPVFVGKEGGPISKSRQTLYNQGMMIPASMERTFPDLTANLQYLTIHEPYLDLNCEGQICQSTSGESDFVIPFGIKRYQFAYDLSFPVLVTIGNPAAFNNRGYTFTFAIEANMRDNKPISKGHKFLIPPETKDVLSSDPFNAIDQRTSGMITINVFNGYSRLSKIPRPAHDAMVSFLCGDKKIQLEKLEDGVIQTRLPRCLNGLLEAKKFRGISDVAEINTMSDNDQEVNLTIYDSVPMNLTFKKLPLRRRVETKTSKIKEVTQMMIIWQADNNTAPVDLTDSEEVTIMLTRVSDYPGQETFSIITTIVGNTGTKENYCMGGETGGTNLNVDVAPGIYDATIIVIDYADNNILPEKRSNKLRVVPQFEDLSGDEEKEQRTNAFTTGGWSLVGEQIGVSPDSLFGDDESTDIDGVDFDCSTPLVTSTITTKYLFTPEHVYDNSVIEFSSFTFDLGLIQDSQRKIEDIQAMTLPGILTPIYYKTLKPKFKKRGFFR